MRVITGRVAGRRSRWYHTRLGSCKRCRARSALQLVQPGGRTAAWHHRRPLHSGAPLPCPAALPSTHTPAGPWGPSAPVAPVAPVAPFHFHRRWQRRGGEFRGGTTGPLPGERRRRLGEAAGQGAQLVGWAADAHRNPLPVLNDSCALRASRTRVPASPPPMSPEPGRAVRAAANASQPGWGSGASSRTSWPNRAVSSCARSRWRRGGVIDSRRIAGHRWVGGGCGTAAGLSAGATAADAAATPSPPQCAPSAPGRPSAPAGPAGPARP